MATMIKEIDSVLLKEMMYEYLESLPALMAITIDGAKEFINECVKKKGMDSANISDEELRCVLSVCLFGDKFVLMTATSTAAPDCEFRITRKHDQEEP